MVEVKLTDYQVKPHCRLYFDDRGWVSPGVPKAVDYLSSAKGWNANLNAVTRSLLSKQLQAKAHRKSEVI